MKKIAIITVHKNTKTGEIINTGVCLYTEVTDEQYKRIEDSYNDGNFEYMSDNPALADVVDLYYDMAQDAVRGEFGEDMVNIEPVIPYPEDLIGADDFLYESVCGSEEVPKEGEGES